MNTADILDDAFLRQEYRLGNLRLRPITLGTMALLRRTRNTFVTGIESENGAEFDTAAFLFIHSEPVDKVCDLVLNGPDFFRAVIRFAERADFTDILLKAPDVVQRMIADASAGKAEPVTPPDAEPGKAWSQPV